MSNTVIRRSQFKPAAGGELHFFWLLLPVFLAVRVVFAGKMLLVPDEAFYWVLSRHLAAGYLDHPPMIAFLIWIGTHLIGSLELGVRLTVVLMAVGALWIVVALARKVLHDTRGTVWVAVIWLTSPLLAAWGTVCTPDTPAMFFSLCALAFVLLIADRDDRGDLAPRSNFGNAGLWTLFGLFSGLAMTSKYTGVLLPAAIALAMLFSRRGRVHYHRPWIYLSGIVAILIFSPVIWWNANHQWASFLYQLHHGTAAHETPDQTLGVALVFRPLRDLVQYVGGQCAVWTPVLFGMALVVLTEYWVRYLVPIFGHRLEAKSARLSKWIERLEAKPRLLLVDQVLLWSATLPLVLFGVAAMRSHHTEVNWPGFAYLPVSLLTVRWLGENWSGRRVKWAHAGVRVALVGLIGMQVIGYPAVSRKIVRLPFHIPHGLLDLNGWPQYGAWLGHLSTETGAPIVTNRHQDAVEASFYMPGQPEVWCDGIGSRPTAFDYFDEKPNFAKIPQVLWIGGNNDLFEKAYGYTEVAQFSALIIPGHNARSYTALLLARLTR